MFHASATYFLVIDLGMNPQGNPDVSTNAFLPELCTTLEIRVGGDNYGTNVCGIIHLLHELIQADLITAEDLVNTLARQDAIKGWLSDRTKKDLFELVPELCAAFSLDGKFATILFDYDSKSQNYVRGATLSFDDVVVPYTWEEVTEESETMLFADVADSHEAFLESIAKRSNGVPIPVFYIICVDKSHFVIARPANRSWASLDTEPNHAVVDDEQKVAADPAGVAAGVPVPIDAAPAAERVKKKKKKKKSKGTSNDKNTNNNSQRKEKKKKRKKKDKDKKDPPEAAAGARRSARALPSSARLDSGLSVSDREANARRAANIKVASEEQAARDK
jgi:hypothetical protein